MGDYLNLFGEPLTAAEVALLRKGREQACRQTWRALLLCVKAKLESVAAGIETFDQAFLAHVMLPTGETVGEWAARPEGLQAALDNRPMPPLLDAPPS